MFWIVILMMVGLAGFAFGWITVQRSRERIIVTLETAKVRPAIDRVKELGSRFLNPRHRNVDKSRHS